MNDISTPSDGPQQLTDISCVDKVISHMLAPGDKNHLYLVFRCHHCGHDEQHRLNITESKFMFPL